MHDPLAFSDSDMSKLGLTLDFGPADLDDNRDGALSPAQVARLETDLRWFYWPMIIGLVAVAFFIGVTSAVAGTLALVPVVFFMAAAAVPAVLLYVQRQGLADQPVLHTTLRVGGLSLVARRWGLIDESESGLGGNVTLPVEGGKKIFATKHLYKSLQSNRTYIAYYAPVRTWTGFRLLSVEPLDAPEASDRREKPKRTRKPKRG